MVPLCLFAIAVGIWFLLSALLNWEWYKAIYDVAATETLFGETVARWSFGLGGAAIIGYGVYYLIWPY